MEIYSVYKPLKQLLPQPSATVTLTTWQNETLDFAAEGTHYGFVYAGQPTLHREQYQQTFSLYPGMYFCLPEGGQIDGKNSCGMVISVAGDPAGLRATVPDRGQFLLGGPVEPQGRYAYIDGGTNSVLIPPCYLGTPCLNALYFPPNCDQTMHSHPSCRIGIVLTGSGEAETPDSIFQMQPGTLFVIPANSLHKFRTRQDSISFVMFHPDSDIGFTHQQNPMLSRTIVDGISAVNLPRIQTAIDRMNP